MKLQNAAINNSVTWTRKDSIGETLIVENGVDTFKKIFSSGTGIGQVSKVWYTTGSLAGNSLTGVDPSSQDYDLFNLRSNLFDNIVTTNLSGYRIKCFYIENISTGNTKIDFAATSSSGFTSTMNLFSIYSILDTGSNYFMTNPVGYLTSTGDRSFTILNEHATDTAKYSIVILA